MKIHKIKWKNTISFLVMGMVACLEWSSFLNIAEVFWKQVYVKIIFLISCFEKTSMFCIEILTVKELIVSIYIAKNVDFQVFSSKSRPELSLDPPSPETSQPPTRRLSEGWNEYDTHDGRKYFYNLQTKEKRWKPPRRNQLADVSFILYIIIM